MKSNRLKILYIHHDALLTGSLVSLRNMLNAIDKKLFEPIVILPADGPAKEVLISDGYQVHVCPFAAFFTTPGPRCFSRDNLKQLLGMFPSAKLRRYIKKIQPDLIHVNDKAAMNAGVSCIGLRIPIVQHSRSAFHLTACAFNKWLSKLLIKLYANHIICISEDEEQGFENRLNKTIVFNTVNQMQSAEAIRKREQTRASLGINSTDFVIGIAENLGVYKGLFEVIKLTEELLRKPYLVNVKIMLVGHISDSDSLARYGIELSSKAYINDFIKKHNFHNKMIVTGYRKDALDLIASMDTILIAKAHGVLGRQPIEAQSVGVPVVAINGHSGRSTIVKNGITGFLVKQYSDLLSAIENLINNESLKNNMSIDGMIYAKAHFDPHINTEKIQHIYQRILKKT